MDIERWSSALAAMVSVSVVVGERFAQAPDQLWESPKLHCNAVGPLGLSVGPHGHRRGFPTGGEGLSALPRNETGALWAAVGQK